MAVKDVAAFGIYPDQGTVNDAVESLKAAGFRQTDISVLFPENLGSKDFAHEKHTKAPDGAVIGAALGWLVGAGALLIPGMEPMQAAGPMIGMLGGMGVGVTLGGLTG